MADVSPCPPCLRHRPRQVQQQGGIATVRSDPNFDARRPPATIRAGDVFEYDRKQVQLPNHYPPSTTLLCPTRLLGQRGQKNQPTPPKAHQSNRLIGRMRP